MSSQPTCLNAAVVGGIIATQDRVLHTCVYKFPVYLHMRMHVQLTQTPEYYPICLYGQHTCRNFLPLLK